MANAISIFTSGSTRAELNKIQAGIVANLQKNSNVFRFKSNSANLSQKAGSARGGQCGHPPGNRGGSLRL